MRIWNRLAGVLLIGGAFVTSFSIAGCSGTVRYYDADHRDYHRWNNHEVVVYRSYWDGHHQSYREYSTLNPDEQRDYWKWRHDHH